MTHQPPTNGVDARSEGPLNVVISNSVSLNGGDAAIIAATVSSLRAATNRDLAVTVLDRQPDLAASILPSFQFDPWPWNVFFRGQPRFLPRRLARALTRARAFTAAYLIGRGAAPLARPLLRRPEWNLLRRYSHADLVISKGGTYLVEIYNLAPHVFDLRLCLLLRLPLVLGAQSLGPFTRRQNVIALRRILPRARLVLLRDELSLAHLKQLRVPTENVRVVADAAFGLADPETLRAARTRRPASPLRVAVSVREWRHFRSVDPSVGRERYIEAVRALAICLVRSHGARLTFVSTCQGVPGYWTDDARMATELVTSLPPDVASATFVDVAFHTTEELRELLASFDIAVATRMHFAILALTAGVPVLPIAYEFKTKALFDRLGMPETVLDIDTIDTESALAAIDEFLGSLTGRRAAMFDSVEKERKAAGAAAALAAEVATCT